eukprot:1156582-Pelagomonas_calceolata.AAC.3
MGAKMPALTLIRPIFGFQVDFGSSLINWSGKRGGDLSQSTWSMVTHERIWQAKVVQTWKPGKHYAWPHSEYGDFMLPRYTCQVLGTKCAGIGSGQAVTAGALTKTPGSG